MNDRLVLALPEDARPGVVWCAPLLNFSGYADEARAFVLGLRERGVELRAEAIGDPSSAFVKGLSPAMKDALDAATRASKPRHSVNVLHVPGEAAKRFPGASYHVARTMFETDGLPRDWVPRLNEMDELWVPSVFNVETFRAAGVTVPMFVVPGGVHPAALAPAEPLPIEGLNSTVFLSVFEWSFRKGWDVLLRAWAKAFSPHDDVTLLLRTYPMKRAGGRVTTDDDIERQINTFLGQIGTSRKKVAPIVVLHDHVADADMPRLYAAATAYVSPTRGEGWGRPMLEAMAAGLPTIATRWSGNLAFMNDDNSLLVDVERLEKVDYREELAFYRGQRWAKPSASHLAVLLETVAAAPEAAAARGRRAQEDVAAHWTWSAAVDVAAERLEEINAGMRRATPRPGGVPVRWVGEQYSWHSLAQVNRELCARLAATPAVDLEVATREHALHRPVRGDAVAAVEARTGDVLDRPARVEVRHQWPPNWTAPRQGAWVAIQPWEFGGLPDEWLPALTHQVDEVWCYTDFVRDCYVASGVPAERIRVIPLGVDAARFTPDGPRFALQTHKTTRLLFVGGTIERKGIDVLLDAYTASFTRDDDVCLVIKSTGSDTVYKHNSADARVRALAADPSQPAIELVTDDLSADDIAALYRSCDALVHPYRGEGFGLPIAEAMACGLPVIVTDYGAARDFCDAQTAYLIPASVVPVPEGGLVPNTTGYWWAEPDRDALGELMRHVVASPDEARARGELGRQRIVRDFTWERAASLVEERLTALAAVVPVRFSEHVPAEPAPAKTNQLRFERIEGGLVSACMIVRDEAENLPGCLAALEGMVDEIVVCDTGSTDDTREIARAAGAVVIETEWTDDFAAARNTALAACTGTWILWIDADDRLRGDPAAFRKVLAGNPPVDTIALTIDQLDATGTAVGFSDQNVRLFRRTKGQWAGRLHETVVARPGKTALRPGFTTDVWFLHSGYATEAVAGKAKAERNIRIGELELAEGPAPSRRAFVLVNLGRSLAGAGRLDEAVARFEEALALTKLAAERRRALRHGAEALLDAGRPADALDWIERLRAVSTNTDMADWLEAIARTDLGDLDAALAKLTDLHRVRDDDGLVLPDHVVRMRRARTLRDAGRHAEAADDLLAIIDDNVAPPWAMLAEANAAAGRDATLVAAAIPQGQLTFALGQLLGVAPEVADGIAEAMFARFPGDAAALAFASEIAPRLPIERALEWSARLRHNGLPQGCPLVAIASDASRSTADRVQAACLINGAFGDHDAARAAARAVAPAIADTDMVTALVLMGEMAPELLPDFVVAAAADRRRAYVVAVALNELGAPDEAAALLAMVGEEAAVASKI